MKYEIEIEGLPEGWEIEKCDIKGDISSNDASFKYINAVIKITKKQQRRRIVLEETDEENHLYESGQYAAFSAGKFVISGVRNKWREVNENDSSLTNEEPKLSLSVGECRKLYQYMDSSILRKLHEFIKDK